MTEAMEKSLAVLLDGQAIVESTGDLCDFTLDEQNAATEAQGVQVQPNAMDFVPILNKSVTYVVACVLINDRNEVLMIQEAKESCAGKWYLPAGRMEQGESIVESTVREVLEETGLDVDVTTLLGMECAGGSWFRFVLTGRIIGGELKTPQRADKESLQAKWIANLKEVNLRANDIIPLIDLAKSYQTRTASEPPWHQQILPAVRSHAKNYLRVVAVIKRRSTNRINILLSEKNSQHFPNTEIHPARSIHAILRKFMIEIFGAELPQHRPHGVLSVEHGPQGGANATPSDGICLTILVAFRPALEDVSILKSKCVWHEVSKPLGDRLCEVLSSKNSTLALHVLR